MDELLDGLRAQGRLEGKGHFTVDAGAAQRVLQRYQLAETHGFVLRLVASAVAGGASRLHMYTDADDCILEHDGQVPTLEELGRLRDILVLPRHTRAPRSLRELALGLNVAAAMDPLFLVVDCWDGRQGSRLQVRGKDWRVQRTPPPTGLQAPGVRIHLRDRLGLRTVRRFFARLLGLPPEGELVQRYCCHAGLELTVNGRPVIRPVELGPCLVWSFLDGGQEPALRLPLAEPACALQRRLRAPGRFSAVLGLAPWREGPCLKLVVDGVLFEVPRADLGSPCLRAVVAAPGLSLDLSRGGVVQDRACRELLALLRAEARQMEELYLGQQAEPPGSEALAAAEVLEAVAARKQGEGDLAGAEQALSRALALRHRHQSPADPQCVAAACQMASVRLAQGQTREAGDLMARAMELLAVEVCSPRGRTLPLGGGPRQVLREADRLPSDAALQLSLSLRLLAQALGRQGRLDQALPLARKALDLLRRHRPAEAPEVLLALLDLARLLEGAGRLQESQRLHAEVAPILEKMARQHRARRDPDGERGTLERLLVVLGRDPDRARRVLHRLAELCRQAGDQDAASRYDRAARGADPGAEGRRLVEGRPDLPSGGGEGAGPGGRPQPSARARARRRGREGPS